VGGVTYCYIYSYDYSCLPLAGVVSLVAGDHSCFFKSFVSAVFCLLVKSFCLIQSVSAFIYQIFKSLVFISCVIVLSVISTSRRNLLLQVERSPAKTAKSQSIQGKIGNKSN